MKNKIVLFDIDYTLFDTATFKDSSLTNYSLYDEIVPVLESLKDVSELGIFSKGDDFFQNTKLKETGIGDFFQRENIHIFEDKDINLENVINKYIELQIYIVDDRLATLYNAKTINPLVATIWVKRGPFAQDDTLLTNFTPDNTIVNLEEVVEIVSK